MGNANWRRATKLYRIPKSVSSAVGLSREATRESERNCADIFRTAQTLEAFLKSEEGKDALDLLEASRRWIVFGEEYEGSGYGCVYFLDASGLQESYEAMGTWMAYAKEVPKPKISHMDTYRFVRRILEPRVSNLKPDTILDFLKNALDGITAEADKNNKTEAKNGEKHA